MNTDYPHLFSPFELGRLTLANRMVVPALTTNFAEADGSVGDGLINYLVERARGGFGAVISENIGVDPGGRVMARMIMADNDSYLPGLTRLATSVKAAGGVLIGQISHAGRQTRSAITGQTLVAPSPIPCPLNREIPHELTIPEIEALERAFVDTASRLARAGFDGIEIHAAHGYLVAEFLSPHTNTRSDAYGGSLHNRMRFLRNIVRGIQGRLGADFPLIVRISAEEFVKDGLDTAQSIEIAGLLEAEGIHALSVSVGVYESFNKLSMITGEPEGQWLALAGQIKATTSLPIIGVGRIKRAFVAEESLAAGQIDLAAFGRASIADPHLPRKLMTGQDENINWCLSCNICLGRSSRPECICPVNPLVGREALHAFKKAQPPRQIAIYGSCLSALTAAWIAAERNHNVTIIAPADQQGGMQAWRANVPGQEEHGEVLAGVQRRAVIAGVQFVETLPETLSFTDHWRVRSYQPTDQNRLAAANAVSSFAVLAGDVPILKGQNIVAVGDDLATAEAALFAVTQGANVSLVTTKRAIATDGHPGYREATKRKLLALGANLVVGVETDEMGMSDVDLQIIGKDPTLSIRDPQAWKMPDGEASAILSDAYEPGAFTTCVYEAVDIALGFDGP
ncbi:MAG: hypothetical protein KUG74_10360 [Rhodobacteraceae bacterium]|nr:hypothetical protein [Paracoccaceae bacterium]